MKKISLTQGQFALVDDEDFEFINQFKWYAAFDSNTNSYYAYRAEINKMGKQKTILMHRFVLGITGNLLVDHKDHDTLNNKRSNLRLATPLQNMANRKSYKSGVSSYKGVYRESRKYKDKIYFYWRATISFNYKRISIGNFKTEKEAAIAYNKKAIELHGEFAYLNYVA